MGVKIINSLLIKAEDFAKKMGRIDKVNNCKSCSDKLRSSRNLSVS